MPDCTAEHKLPLEKPVGTVPETKREGRDM